MYTLINQCKSHKTSIISWLDGPGGNEAPMHKTILVKLKVTLRLSMT